MIKRHSAKRSRKGLISAIGTGAALAASLGAIAGVRQIRTDAPAAAIAAGAPLWVDSNPDPQFALIDALVDIGTLRQSGDAIEAQLSWTLKLGMLRDLQAAHPETPIPENSISTDAERIVCGPEGALSYRVAATITSPDGTVLLHRTYDPDRQRKEAETQERNLTAILHRKSGYGPDPRSLVCWAAARKCENKPYHWPPPPNLAPLEYSERAEKMRSDYNRQFVPRCRL